MALSSLEEHLGFWLRFVSNHVSASFARRMEEFGLSVSEWVALRTIYAHEDIAAMSLVDALGMTKGAVSKLVTRLETAQLLVRSLDEHDGRVQRIALSPAGRKLVPRLTRAADENDAAFFGHMSEREQQQLKKMMIDLVRRHELRGVPVE